MRTSLVGLLSLVACATAYEITFPGANDTWNAGSATNKLTWKRDSTDPEYFTLILSNGDTSIIPGNNMDLIANVSGLSGSISVPTPSGGLPVGKGFRLTFLRNTTQLIDLYAQTQDFEIASRTHDSASNGAISVVGRASPVVAGGAIIAAFLG